MLDLENVADWEVWQFAARLSPLTNSERIRVINQFGADTGVQPARATPLEIVRWLAAHEEWSDSTACTYHAYLSAWFKWLQRQDHRLDNPMIKVGTPRYPDREPRPVSDANLVKLLTTRMHHKTRGMILLAALEGFRVGQICKIRGEDVDLSIPNIYNVGKRKKGRSYPLHPLVVEFAQTMPRKSWWFPANSKLPNEHMHSKSVSDVVGRTMRRAGIPGTPHSLRHWYGTTLLDDGADLRTVQELMGHTSITSTQIYTKVPDQRRINAVGRLDLFRYAKSA